MVIQPTKPPPVKSPAADPPKEKSDEIVIENADDSAEIVVEEGPTQIIEAEKPVASTPESIVLLEEEKPANKKQSTVQNTNSLEEILFWLHDQLPLSDEELSLLCITMDDFKAALKSVQPSAKREGFVTVPDTNWEDVGSLKDIREELQLSIVVSIYLCS